MHDMIAPKSKSTARDMVRGILEDVSEIPTMNAAKRIAEEYMQRGVYVKPEYLLDVWMEEWERWRNESKSWRRYRKDSYRWPGTILDRNRMQSASGHSRFQRHAEKPRRN